MKLDTSKPIIPEIGTDWDKYIKDDFQDENIQRLLRLVDKSVGNPFIVIFPPKDKLFSFLKNTSYADTKVVILGQDPYINRGQANGMAFSVDPGVPIPGSLQNIYKELSTDIPGFKIPNNGYLLDWAKQGVLLMNCCLTVFQGQSASHQGKGWELLTDHIIKLLNDKETPVVFMLWGMFAKAKKELITNPRHLVLEAQHPSPLTHGAFFGCKHFSKCNEFLNKNGMAPIDWQIKDV